MIISKNYNDIDVWLDAISDEARHKVLHVVSILDMEWQLRDYLIFNIPLSNLLKDSIVSREELISILGNLQDKQTMVMLPFSSKLRKEIDETFHEYDPEIPEPSTLEITQNIIDNLDTQIRLLPVDRFNYLKTRLKYEATNKIRTRSTNLSKKIKWQKEFIWESDNVFRFGENGSVEFTSKDSDRKTVFMLLTKAQGEWLTVSKMADVIRKTPMEVRIIIDQINKKKLVKTNFVISPRYDGAYRIAQRT